MDARALGGAPLDLLQERAGILDHRFDLPPVPDDAGVGEQPGHVVLVHLLDLGRVEAVERQAHLLPPRLDHFGPQPRGEDGPGQQGEVLLIGLRVLAGPLHPGLLFEHSSSLPSRPLVRVDARRGKPEGNYTRGWNLASHSRATAARSLRSSSRSLLSGVSSTMRSASWSASVSSWVT